MDTTSTSCSTPKTLNDFSTEPAWKSIDVVLDVIMKLLTVEELKNFRMVCRTWAFAGARLLVRQTLIRLTGIVNLKPVAEKVPVLTGHNSHDSCFFECECVLESSSKEYSYIDSYGKFLAEDVKFDSNFKPLNVSVVCVDDVWKLPINHLSSLQSLQVLTFRPSEGFKLLNEFHLLFPNLTSLELCNVQTEVLSTSSSLQFPSLNYEREKQPEIRLEKLVLCISQDSDIIGVNILKKFSKLKVLMLNWGGRFVSYLDLPSRPRRQYAKGDLYSHWVHQLAFFTNFKLLNDISLRFENVTTNIEGVPATLNSMKLRRLSIQLFGYYHACVSRFILGLSSATVGALDTLHVAGGFLSVLLTDEIVTWLGDNGFFEKLEWALTFRIVYPVWFSLVKTKSTLVLQSPGFNEPFGMKTIFSKYLKISAQYNYSFCRVLLHDHTRISRQELLPPRAIHNACFMDHRYDLLTGTCKNIDECLLCKKSSPLLCDYPEFLTEAGIVVPHEHTISHDHASECRTRFFCYVDPAVLRKWVCIRDQQTGKTETASGDD